MGLFSSSDPTVLASIARVERKLDAVLDHLGIVLTDDGLGEIRDLMASGRKIDAIKSYRELAGCGLAEAKDAVERGL
ncbi:MAG: hypothetical protein KDA25_03530 [Phycisphaerales bacterium]|nr:hypothetical protein [Phycisphaerales bacterium]